jgi:hypothetical protein
MKSASFGLELQKKATFGLPTQHQAQHTLTLAEDACNSNMMRAGSDNDRQRLKSN